MQKEKDMDNYKCPNVGCRSSFKYRSQRSCHLKMCEKEPPTVEMTVFNEFIGSISIIFVLVLLFVIIHNLNSK